MLTLSEERKFYLIFAEGSKSSRERVPGNESSLVPGSESTWERKFLLPLQAADGEDMVILACAVFD